MSTTVSDAAMGMRLAHEGRYSDALPYLERANRAMPADVAILNAVGNLLTLAGRGEDALSRYQIAAAALPRDLKLLCGWARICLMLERAEQAVDLFDRAIAVDRRCANPGGWMDSILKEVASQEATISVTQALVDRHPAHNGLRAVNAKALLAAECLAKAQAALEACLALYPRDVWARVQLGTLAVGRDEPEVGRTCFQAVLQIDPINPDALWGLAELDDFRPAPAVLAAVKRAIALKPPTLHQARLHETLARCHDRAGDTPAAWRHAARANALRVESKAPEDRYSASKHSARVDSLIANYQRALLNRLQGAGSPDRRPLFVIGLPRSGTTLLERMLASHPLIVGVGEQRFSEASWKRALAACGQDHQALTAEAVAAAAAWHVRTLEQRVHNLGLPADAQRIVDKLPDNYLMAGWLRIAFPNAAIVHILRDPRDVALSCWLSQFGDNSHWINELRHIAHRIEEHRRLLRHWRTTLGADLTEVRYEEFIADPHAHMRRILAAAGMEWHPDVFAFSQRHGYVATASRMQVREPVHTRNLARWRKYAGAMEPILARLDAVAIQDTIDFRAPVTPRIRPVGAGAED